MPKYEDLNPIPDLKPQWLVKFYANIKINRIHPFCWEWEGQLNRGGYGLIRLGKKQYTVSRVAYKIYNNLDPGNLYVCHECNNPKCLKKEHLYLDDQVGNMAHAHLSGRITRRGRGNGRAILHESDIHEIFKLRDEGFTLIELAKKFAVGRTTISCALSGESWQHVFRV